MPEFEVLLANPRGFCAGVVRAIAIVEQALARFGAPIYVRHEVVHNKFVVDDLRAKGAIFVDELFEVPPGGTVVSYASTLMDPAALGPRWFGAHVGTTLRSMLIFLELRHTQTAASDLRSLFALIAAGLLKPHIDVEADWTRGGELARDLLARKVTGKVVLNIGSGVQAE